MGMRGGRGGRGGGGGSPYSMQGGDEDEPRAMMAAMAMRGGMSGPPGMGGRMRRHPGM